MPSQEHPPSRPPLLFEEYFAGATRAWGLVEDRFGNIRREFTVDMFGIPQPDGLVLNETFAYSDGQTDQRVWTVRKTAPDRYEGRAADVIGVARGVAAGNTLRWRYRMDLPIGGSRWRLSFDDRMVLQDGGVLLNRTRMSRWGVEIGSLALVYFKQGAPALKALSTLAVVGGKG